MDQVLDAVQGDIVMGIPFGVGKPNPFVNALFGKYVGTDRSDGLRWANPLCVKVQAEAAVRLPASGYAYDDGEDLSEGEYTLRGGTDEVALALRAELQERFGDAGIAVIDAKLSHVAYAPEIAQMMLRRQQAQAIVSARRKIVQGAVGMVKAALNGLSERKIVALDDARRPAMVSDLLVVLCSDNDTQPVVNAGTRYS